MPNPPRLVKLSVLLPLGLWAARGASGQTWSIQVRGGGTELTAISAYSGQVAYAVGDSGKVFKTLDGGAHWDLTGPTGAKGFLYGVSVMDANTVYATETRGTLLKTADGGATWQTHALGGPTIYSLAVGAVDARTVYACGEKGAVFKTGNGGLSWENQSIETTALTCHLAAVDLNTVYVAYSDSTVHKTVDGGKNWIKLPPPMNEGKRVYLAEMDAVDADTIFGTQRLNDGGAQVNVTYRRRAPSSNMGSPARALARPGPLDGSWPAWKAGGCVSWRRVRMPSWPGY